MSQINIMINTENVIYTDTLSVKSSILNTLKTLDRSVLERFVLSHPIAGSEKNGLSDRNSLERPWTASAPGSISLSGFK